MYNPRYPDVMVDLETTGTDPRHSAILQLAAVKFNFATGEIDPLSFNRALAFAPGRYWDHATLNWWMNDTTKRSILNDLLARGEDPKTVMDDFLNWCGGDLRLFAKPSHFEHPFLSSYFEQFAMPSPFHYRKVIDCRSIVCGLYYPEAPVDPKDVPFTGAEHNAIDDVFHQLTWLLLAKHKHKEPVDANPSPLG